MRLRFFPRAHDTTQKLNRKMTLWKLSTNKWSTLPCCAQGEARLTAFQTHPIPPNYTPPPPLRDPPFLNRLFRPLGIRRPASHIPLTDIFVSQPQPISYSISTLNPPPPPPEIIKPFWLKVLYCPVMWSHFLHSLGNYTRRAIFPEMCKINQSVERRLSW